MALDTLNTKDTDRFYRIGSIPNIESLASELRNLTEPFVLLLALDATNLSDDQIINAAREVVDNGLAYLCVWGPDCERVHDLFDQEIVRQRPDERSNSVTMTTWHEDEPLSQAIWFFEDCTCPADNFAHCKNWIAVAIDNPDWADKIRTTLSRAD